MKATDLRIGNYYDHHGTVTQVTPTTIEDVYQSERIWCKPIQLTEEWLIKFGFEKQYDEGVYEKNNNRIELIIWGDADPEWKFRKILGNHLNYWRHSMPAVKHVHQLQNLFFALCGEELQIQNI